MGGITHVSFCPCRARLAYSDCLSVFCCMNVHPWQTALRDLLG